MICKTETSQNTKNYFPLLARNVSLSARGGRAKKEIPDFSVE
jgi:hypothetical protein